MSKITLSLVIALVLGSASAALAAPMFVPIAPSTTVTDEGQGRTTSVHAPGP